MHLAHSRMVFIPFGWLVCMRRRTSQRRNSSGRAETVVFYLQHARHRRAPCRCDYPTQEKLIDLLRTIYAEEPTPERIKRMIEDAFR